MLRLNLLHSKALAVPPAVRKLARECRTDLLQNLLPPIPRIRLCSIAVPHLRQGQLSFAERQKIAQAVRIIISPALNRVRKGDIPDPNAFIEYLIEEAAYNLAMHGGGGVILISIVSQDHKRAIEIAARDFGVGIPAVDDLIAFEERLLLRAETQIGAYIPRQKGLVYMVSHADQMDVETLAVKWRTAPVKPKKLAQIGTSSVVRGTYIRLLKFAPAVWVD
jgi:hypothetical protein